MKIIKVLLSLFSIILINSCGITKEQKMGNVLQSNFQYKTNFTTLKTLIIIPAELDGIEKNFLFDTGAEMTIIQRDSTIGESSSIRGASSVTVNGGTEIVKSLKIGNVEFANTFAVNMNLFKIEEQIPNFGGLIGQTIIGKANWLIDYPNRTIEVSDKDLTDLTFQNLQVKLKSNVPHTYIKIDGKKHEVLIDLGASTEFILDTESELAKELLKKYDFKNNERERYTIGDASTSYEKVGFIPLIKIGELEFKNVKLTITNSKKPRIGISFFREYKFYIDNTNKSYKIKK